MMEGHIERESGALGGLFQQIIQDMKNGMPLWEDLIAKAAKLHSSLKATILAVTAYLEAFQKIADSATNARGATREIGTALTRICLRHKAVEARMKTFTSTIMELLIIPLQEKLEDWKKTVLNLDKEHAKDYKRARADLKKRSTDTLRLQKKMRKGAGGDLQKRLECGLQDVTERRQLLEETEKHAVRAALIEERSRFCTFVGLLKPVVDEEVAMLTEMSHLQEAVQQLEKHTADPSTLPPASEQVIADLKSSDSGWSFQTPPSSPSSLGSRKSSMCSISSLNSSSSGSSKNHHSPSHPHWQRSLSQVSNMSEHSSNSSSSSTPCTPFPATVIPTTTSTWPNLQETMQFERAASAIINDRPHTISSAYEKGHQRPPLTVYTFQAPDQSLSQPVSPVTSITPTENNNKMIPPRSPTTSIKSLQSKPPLPTRCSSLERPSGPNVPAKTIAEMQGVRVLPPTTSEQVLVKKPSSLPAHLTKNVVQPTYVNMHELASMAAKKAQEMSLPPPPADFIGSPATEKAATEGEKDGSTSESSLESSSGYGSQTTFTAEDPAHAEDVNDSAMKYCTLPRNSDLNSARRRPLSMTAIYSTGTIRSSLARRASMQANKPPPPIRRTSSITNTSTAAQPSAMGSLENLPPPPAFLLEPSTQQQKHTGMKVAETVKALTELKHTPASPNSIRRMSASSQSIYQSHSTTPTSQQGPVLSTFQAQTKVSYVSQSGGVVYAQPSQVLCGSPTATRRVNSFRSQSAERRSGPVGVGSNFIATLSAKLAPNLSPRTARRHSEDLVQSPPTKIVQRGPGQSFLDSLNAKLAQQHITNSTQATQHKATKIRQIINSKAQPDPKVCHESLMDQIKRGATLRRAEVINDRSAPKIY
ncbi:protein MTSS 2 isoform X4 [Tribolium castaneum]|uniref:protein MTSS 2 isoform X4 n=1 Tax=Tribolium castaneum TaxID=7070 RepID=UPI00077DB7B4|nr:PREDICTED: MTSS1-like protein isoform X5 [Tribolium castaneum]|eukprot:XP_015837248.1 PREDICTED: MTSS1-like protein isoform X5 [Tribolium castaneum]